MDFGRPRLMVSRGEVLGVALPRPEREGELEQALRQEGISLDEPGRAEEGTLGFTQECEEENPRPCEVTVVTDRIEELAAEAGTPYPEITAMKERGAASEKEIRDTLRGVIDRMPAGEVRDEAQLWWDAGFGQPLEA